MYEERWAKVGVRWSEAGDTVKYKLKKTFIFRQDLSGQLTEDDRVTLPNVPLFVSIEGAIFLARNLEKLKWY